MDYWRPESLEEALKLLANRPRVAAGCTDLFPATDRPDLMIGQDRPILDITGICELRGLEVTTDGLRLGATATWSDVVRADLPPCCAGLQAAAREIGAIQIQNAGTIGGNLCNASPAADSVPPLLTLDAQIELQSARGRRTLPLDQFIKGPRQTACGQDEMLTAILLPHHALTGSSGFYKLGARHYLVISIVMAAMRLVTDANGTVRAYVSVGACSPVAKRLPLVEQAIVEGREIMPEMLEAELDPISDIRGDASHRLRSALVLISRLRESLIGPGAMAA